MFVDLLWFCLSNLESPVTSEFSIPYSRNSRVDGYLYVYIHIFNDYRYLSTHITDHISCIWATIAKWIRTSCWCIMSGAECRRSRVQEPLLSGKKAGSFTSLLSLQYRQLVWSTSTICTSINGLKQEGSVSVITKCPPSVCRIARLRMARGRASRSHENWHAIQKQFVYQPSSNSRGGGQSNHLIYNPSHVQSYVANQNGPNGFCFLLS